jgi:hypothetical protein
MKNLNFSLLFILLLSSCGFNSDLFTENSVNVKNFKQEKRLMGTVLIDNEYGHFNIAYVEKYLVLFSTKREHFFNVYSTNGDSLGNFGIKGRGPNDLINIRWCGQSYGANMWINDVSNMRLCAIDIEQSLSKKECIIHTVKKSTNYAINSFIWNDSLLICEQMKDDNFYLIKTNYNTQKTSEEKLYKYPSPHLFSTYKSICRMKPDGSKMVFAMQSINMVNILDLENNSRKSLIIVPPMINLNSIIDENTGLEKRTYYADMEVTNDYIYMLYMNQEYDESYEVEKEMEIHVFDWHGNPFCKYIVTEYIIAMAVDEKNGCIYGLSQNEMIYVYKTDSK